MNATSPKCGLFSSLLVVALLSCCATLILSSCSKKTSVAIIGKWRAQATKEIVEFRKDGTLITAQEITAGPPGNTQTVKNETTGTYTFTDSSHMNMQINTDNTNQPTISVSCEVRIDGDKMSIVATVSGHRQPQRTSLKRMR